MTVSVSDTSLNDAQSFTIFDPSIPAVSEWGMVAMVLLVVTMASVLMTGRKQTAA